MLSIGFEMLIVYHCERSYSMYCVLSVNLVCVEVLSKAISSPSIDRLGEQNRALSCQTLSSNPVSVATTVVAPSLGMASSDPDLSSMSLFSVGAYDDFAVSGDFVSSLSFRCPQFEG